MKTSNKILIGGFVFLMLLAATGMLIAKSNVVISKAEDRKNREGVGNGQLETKQIADSISSSVIKLGNNYFYELDPNSKGIVVTTDSNLFSQIKISDDGTLRFYRQGPVNFEPSEQVKVVLGIADKPQLTIMIKRRTILRSKAIVTTDLTIHAEDDCDLKLDISNDQTTINAENKARVELRGVTNYLNVSSEDRVTTDATKCEVSNLKLTVTDESTYHGGRVKTVTIQAEDNARISLAAAWERGMVDEDDRAVITIAGERYHSETDKEDDANY